MTPGIWPTRSIAQCAVGRWIKDPTRTTSVFDCRTAKLCGGVFTFRYKTGPREPWLYANEEGLSP